MDLQDGVSSDWQLKVGVDQDDGYPSFQGQVARKMMVVLIIGSGIVLIGQHI